MTKTTEFAFKTRKKNDYQRLEVGAYPRQYVRELKADAAAIAMNDISSANSVRLDWRSGRYRLTIGFGNRHTWFENRYIPRGDFVDCANAEEALRSLTTIIKAAEAGEFDAALEDLRKKRQEHAEAMIEARHVCGFHAQKPPTELGAAQ